MRASHMCAGVSGRLKILLDPVEADSAGWEPVDMGAGI